MPDDPNRLDNEAKLQAVIAALLLDLEQAALSRLGDRPMMDDLPQWFYAQAKQVIKAEISPILKDIAFDAAIRTGDELGWDLNAIGIASEINRRIDNQATLVAESILTKLQKQVGDRVRQVRDGELALGAYLYMLWGEKFPESLSITETTRAISAGENATTREVEREIAQRRREVLGSEGAAEGDEPDDGGPVVEPQPGQGGARKPPRVQRPDLRLLKVWHTQRDEKVCKICGPLDGKNQRFWADKYEAGPPAHPNCVLAETPVSGSSLVSVLDVQYKGAIVRIHLCDGSSFAVTPNHMLLSPCGFIRAIDLVDGDYLLSAIPVEAAATASPDNNWKPPTAEEVFHSLAVSSSMSPSSVPVSAEYLHGDGAFGQGDINIVRPDSLLRYDLDPGLGEPLNHHRFILGSNATGSLSASRSIAELGEAMGLSSDSGMSRLREREAFLLGQFRHANKIRLASVSDLEPKPGDAFCNRHAAHAQILAHTQDALAPFVTRKQIIKIEVDSVISHNPIRVYDLQTLETIYYIGNGVISSNCRCYLTYQVIGTGL
jgi:hypothetical protein